MMETAPRPRSSLWRRLWLGWKHVGRSVGDFQARVLLTVFYFVVIAPFALIVRWATDPLAVKPATPKGWRPREASPGMPLERARRQF
jgi:hypothetical protein